MIPKLKPEYAATPPGDEITNDSLLKVVVIFQGPLKYHQNYEVLKVNLQGDHYPLRVIREEYLFLIRKVYETHLSN